MYLLADAHSNSIKIEAMVLQRAIKKGTTVPWPDGAIVAALGDAPSTAMWAVTGGKVVRSSTEVGAAVIAAVEAARAAPTLSQERACEENTALGELSWEEELHLRKAADAADRLLQRAVFEAAEAADASALASAWLAWLRAKPSHLAGQRWRGWEEDARRYQQMLEAAEAAGALRWDESAVEAGQVRLLFASSAEIYEGFSTPVALVRVLRVDAAGRVELEMLACGVERLSPLYGQWESKNLISRVWRGGGIGYAASASYREREDAVQSGLRADREWNYSHGD